MKSRAGYTLLELVIACALVTIVLTGLYTMFSSVVNFQTETIRKSGVNAWSNVAMNTMTKEVEDASIVYFPDPTNTTSNAILGCSNWLSEQNGPTSGGAMDNSVVVTYFYYCLDTTSGPNAPNGVAIPVLRRIAASGAAVTCPTKAAYSPGVPPVACTSGVTLSGAGINTNDIIASMVDVPASGKIFTYGGNAAPNSINVAFVIGNQTAETPGTATADAPTNAHIVNPQTTTVNSTLAVNRSYLDTKE